jgi:hypothetical protein
MARQMCQSCGMPLKDKNKGTEKDGSLSNLYCDLCYENGAFKDPDLTLEQMQKICIQAMRNMHFPKFMATRIAKKQLPQLRRWQSHTQA